jgi:lipid-A-disaccharide synthase
MSDNALRVMICAGEHSGDLHGAALVKEASRTRPRMKFFGLGGDLMAAAGVELRAHLKDTAVMGLTEVLGSLVKILKVRSLMSQIIENERPDGLVLIDSPDFNFALAKAATKAGVPVIYYICPQVWAWRQGRLNFLKKFTKRRAVILPFEADFYQLHGVQADLVGHPLLDELPTSFDRIGLRQELNISPKAKILAVLPGSRRSVASKLTGPMLGAVELLLDRFESLVAVLPRSIALDRDFLQSLVEQAPARVRQSLRIIDGRSQEILAVSDAALLASGTSTVEGAVLGTPMVVTYRVSALSYFLAKLMIGVRFVSIANLVADRLIVPELLQSRCNPLELALALTPLLAGGPERDAMVGCLQEVSRTLGGPGASARVLELIDQEIGLSGAGN